jgi:choline dehydrogenase
LSEDPGRDVLLLEAGPDPTPLPEIIASSDRPTPELLSSSYVARLPTPRGDGGWFDSLAGRILGGGSSVNFMDFLRPLRCDFDSWATFGGAAWSYDSLLPTMRAIERDDDFPDRPIHGANGPVFVKRPFAPTEPPSAYAAALIAQGAHLGLPIIDDMNAPEPMGVCVAPANAKDGRRQSSSVAYIDPIRDRPNLEIVAEAAVSELRMSGSRITGVVYRRGGAESVVTADAIVLAAGVFGSPQILMLSGIGSPTELQRHGIEVRLGVPGVGANYQDHAVVFLTCAVRRPLEGAWAAPRLRFLIACGEDAHAPNIHIIPRPPRRDTAGQPAVQMSVHLLEQRNRGRVSLRDGEPGSPIQVESAMLDDPADLAAIVEAMTVVARLVQGRDVTSFIGPIVDPRPRVAPAEFARRTFDSYHHGVGTCRMGHQDDPLAVVDPGLRVNGLENLWVADASVLPTITHSNTNLASMLIGELAAASVSAAS